MCLRRPSPPDASLRQPSGKAPPSARIPLHPISLIHSAYRMLSNMSHTTALPATVGQCQHLYSMVVCDVLEYGLFPVCYLHRAALAWLVVNLFTNGAAVLSCATSTASGSRSTKRCASTTGDKYMTPGDFIQEAINRRQRTHKFERISDSFMTLNHLPFQRQRGQRAFCLRETRTKGKVGPLLIPIPARYCGPLDFDCGDKCMS